jgi:predicted porin
VTDSTIGWGVGASGSVKFGNATLVVSGQGGKGIGYFTFQSLLQTAAFVDDKIEMWEHWTYHAGLTYQISPALRVNGIWTQTFWKEDDALAQASFDALGDIGVNESLNAFYVNAFYSPFKNAEIGLEYNWGQRKIFDDFVVAGNDKGTQSRVNALARYSFF